MKRKGDNKSAVGRCIRHHWGKGGEKKENEGRMGKGNGQGKKMGKIHHKEGREGRSYLHSLHHIPGIHLTPGPTAPSSLLGLPCPSCIPNLLPSSLYSWIPPTLTLPPPTPQDSCVQESSLPFWVPSREGGGICMHITILNISVIQRHPFDTTKVGLHPPM